MTLHPKVVKSLQIYASEWKKQDKIFAKIGERNPYINPKFIVEDIITSEERDLLKTYSNSPDNFVFTKVHSLFGDKLKSSNLFELNYKEAVSKLNYQYHRKIIHKDTITLDRFYYSIPSGIHKPPIKPRELAWLYRHGYLPHLYWDNGNPRFHSDMWFILDFNLREAQLEIGLGIFKRLSDWTPKWYLMRNYLDLMNYMYNSWNLGVAILDYADAKARKSGLTGKDFRTMVRNLSRDLWINEGKIIAEKVIRDSSLVRMTDLLSYYRDNFAFFSFESFPGSALIDIYHSPTARRAVMFSFEEKMRLAVYNHGIADINTYTSEHLSEQYRHLFYASDWALSMVEGVYNRGISDILDLYRRKDGKGKIPCRICGELFKPKRKIDLTCGKMGCIKQNKYLSKKKGRLDMPPLIDKTELS